MGHQMEDAGDRSPTTHGQHHVAELGDGAVGQSLLEVHLCESNGGTQEAGDRANDGDHRLHHRELGVQGIEAGHQEYPCSHHRGGMNQGRNRCWALHGIGEPDMKRELGRLGHRTHEHQQAEQQRCPWRHSSCGQPLLQAIGDSLEIEASGGPEQPKDAQKQAEVTDPVHHKGLLRGMGGTVAVVPEAHQQVGAHAHQLPEDVNFQKIGANNQSQHGAAEQRQVGEKAHIALVVSHVAVGIHQHQQGNGGD